MREISAQKVTEVVKKLCINANCYLPQDVKDRIESLHDAEPWGQAREVLERIIEAVKSAPLLPVSSKAKKGVAA